MDRLQGNPRILDSRFYYKSNHKRPHNKGALLPLLPAQEEGRQDTCQVPETFEGIL